MTCLYVTAAQDPVDRSEWWRHRQGQTGYDGMAAATNRTPEDVSPSAVVIARRYLVAAGLDGDPPRGRALLSRLGVLLPGDRLSQAGALVFCPADRNHLTVTVLDVEGGEVVASPPDFRGLSLLEQVAAVEARLDPLNREVVLRGGFAEQRVRRLPPASLREAILNGLVHRDWTA